MKRVYVVEDEAIVALELVDQLRSLGYEVAGHALRAEEGLRGIEATRPDLVLLDVNLGPGPSGLDVAEEVRARHDVPVLFLSAYSDAEITTRATLTGSFGYLPKPFQREVLKANVELALLRHESERARRYQEEFLRLSQEVARVGSWDWDIASDRIVWSAEMCRLHGKDPERFQPDLASALACYHPADRERIEAGIKDTLRTGAGDPASYRVVLPDGTERIHWVSWRMYFDPAGRPARMIGANMDITERHRADEALRRSEHLLRQSQRLAGIGSWLVELPGGKVTWTEETYRLFGQGPERFTPSADALLSLLHPDDREAMRDQIERFATAPQPPLDFRVVLPDGTTRILSGRGELVRDPDGTPTGIIGAVQDVTAQRRQAATLTVLSTGLSGHAGQDFFDQVALRIAECAGAEIGFIATLRGGAEPVMRTLALARDGMLRGQMEQPVLGTPGELAVMTGQTVVHEDDLLERFPAASATLGALGVRGYAAAPLLAKDGSVLGHVGVMTRSRISNPDEIVTIVRLFALRAAPEVERQRVDAEFSSLFDFAPDALLIADDAGRILLANRTAEEVLGYTGDELRALEVDALVPGPQRLRHAQLRAEYVARPDSRGMSERTSLLAVRKDRSLIPVEIRLSPVHTDQGLRVIAAIRDVSARRQSEVERQRLQAMVERTQRMESLGTLTSGIAHDFNNLLAAIQGHLELARFQVGAVAPVVERLDSIAAAAARGRGLVKRITAFARPQLVKHEVASLASIVDEAANLLRAAIPSGIVLTVEISGDVPRVSCDASQLHQVLMNLATNAWHAIPGPTGRIALRLDRVPATEAGLGLDGAWEGDYARLRVEDDGTGMEAATIDRIFEPFFTTKGGDRGTGLGLAVSHGIIAAHGGLIQVESTMGRGTTFTVLLPAAKERAAVGAEPRRDLVAGTGNVLILDDDPEIVRVGTALIRTLGYHADAFTSPAEAVEALRRSPAAYDAVITDLDMPAMSGLDVARAAAVIRSDLPVVLVSGNRGLSATDLADANVRYTLDKPFTLPELSAVLSSAMGHG